MDAYFDRELNPASAVEVEAHLKGCDRCRRQWGGLVALLTDPLPVRMPAGLSSRIMARVQESCPVAPVRLSTGTSVRWMRWYRYNGAMAACVAFFAFGWLISGWWTSSHPVGGGQTPSSPVATVMDSPWMMSSWVQAAAMPCPISPTMMLVQVMAPEMMIASVSKSEPPPRVRRPMPAMLSKQPADPLSTPELPVLPIAPRFMGA